MLHVSYLAELAVRLAAGTAALPEDQRARHAAFLAAAQRPDGGFAGRQGESDPYYTAFGLRAMALLGSLSSPLPGTTRSVVAAGTTKWSVPGVRAAGTTGVSPPPQAAGTTGVSPLPQAGEGPGVRAVRFLKTALAPPTSNLQPPTSALQPSTSNTPAAGTTGVSPLPQAGEGPGVRAVRILSSVDFLSALAAGLLIETLCGIDVFAPIALDPRDALLHWAERHRRPDGGYAKTLRSGPSSTYHTFLMVATLDAFGLESQEPGLLRQLLLGRQRPDGGFVELDVLRHSGVSPTAAAVAALRIVGGLDESSSVAAAGFLAAVQTLDGGLRANAQAPVADLLSTFTGLTALADLAAPTTIDRAAAGRFVAGLEAPQGGFRAAAWDTERDVEYTFYGLGCLALLQENCEV